MWILKEYGFIQKDKSISVGSGVVSEILQ